MNPEFLGLLNDEVKRGVGSETLLRVLGPILDARIDSYLNALDQAPADLAQLLDLRAKIAAYRTIRKELAQAVNNGKEAGEKLASLPSRK